MNRRPTRDDVARQAGVSKTTVTYVLGDRFDVAIPETTRERVKQAANELGYRPHAAAQALASGQTKTITLAFPIHIASHYAHVLQSFERQTNTHGYHMVTTTIGHVSVHNVGPDLDELLSSLTDGIIFVDMPGMFQPFFEEMLPVQKAVVSAGVFTVPGTDSVRINLERASRDAMDHLLAGNPERLAFFGSGKDIDPDNPPSFASSSQMDARFAAYCRAMRKNGKPSEVITGSPGSRSICRKVMREYIEENGHPDALMCINDEMAIGAVRALRDIGLRVPEDVRIVGCDGSEEAEYMFPALSTILQPVDWMCSEAWKMMARRLEYPDAPLESITIDAEFAARDSSLLPQ